MFHLWNITFCHALLLKMHLQGSIKSSDCNWTRIQNNLVRKWTLNHFATWPVWPNGSVFVYKLSGSGFESSCSHLNFRFRTCFEQGVPWHSGNYRVWIHSETCMCHEKNIQSIKSVISSRFFGSYYHSLVKHSPEQYRILSGRLANTEKEEATFNFIKKATKLTANHHPANVIANAGSKKNNNGWSFRNWKNRIKTDFNLPTNQVSFKKDTIIPYTWITEYKYQYQCLPQSQADFISDEVCWCREIEDSIDFFNISNWPNSKKQLPQFVSDCTAEEVNHIEECWNHLLSLKHKIPAYKIQAKSSLNKSENVDQELFNLSQFSDKTKCDKDQHISSSNSIEIEKSFTKSNSTMNNSLQTSSECNNNEIDFFSSIPQQLGE